jgi:cytochrome b561
MTIKSSALKYGSVAIAFHWLSAILITGMFVAGIVASETVDPGQKAAILRIHAPVGLAVLGLTVLRIVWWLVADKKPLASAGQPRWQRIFARWIHRLFYVAILAMTASGIWLMNASGAGEVIFQGADAPLPAFETFAAYQAHSTIALVMEVLFVLHVLAALYHQFIRKDRLLARMGLGRLSA